MRWAIAGCGRCHAGASCSASAVAMRPAARCSALTALTISPSATASRWRRVARVGGGELARRLAAEGLAGGEGRERPQEQRLADVLAVGAGEDHRERRLAETGLCLQAVAERGRRRSLVAQRLQHADDAVAVAGRADQGLDHPALPERAGADVVDLGARRRLVLDQLLEQVVVVLGQRLEQAVARLVLAVEEAGGDLDELGGRALLVGPGALRDEVDGAGDLLAVADRDLAQDDRVAGVLLKRGDDVADAAGRLVDPVDEEDRRRSGGLGRVEVGRGEDGGGGIGTDADHRGVGGEERIGGDVEELDRARRVDRLPALAEKGEAADPELAGGGGGLRLAFEGAHAVDEGGLAGVRCAEDGDGSRHGSSRSLLLSFGRSWDGWPGISSATRDGDVHATEGTGPGRARRPSIGPQPGRIP